MAELTLEDLDRDEMFDDAVVPIATRRILLQQELAQWNNTAYLSRRRYQLAKNLGAAPEALDAERKQFAQALEAIGLLTHQIEALDVEQRSRAPRAAPATA